MKGVRQTVLSSLAAVGATHEAQFYADLFAKTEAERFALILLESRVLKNPLLEALTSGLQILANLGLYPILLIGALEEDRTAIKFQAQRLTRDLDTSGVKCAKLNTASYGLIAELRRRTREGIIPVLEMTERRGKMTLTNLVSELKPSKIVSLQPSGGLNRDGVRRRNLRLSEIDDMLESDELSAGQAAFLRMVQRIERDADTDRRSYVLASPLNLLTELFTTKGSGTLIRRGAVIKTLDTLDSLPKQKLRNAIGDAFGRPLDKDYLGQPIRRAFIETDLRAGAILHTVKRMPYLSKFWVIPEAQGDGLARDIWEAMAAETPALFWRSRQDNPFTDWYLGVCDGMQRQDGWRVFWKGLDADAVPKAIAAAAGMGDDFGPTA